ncbi:MAG: hypothetical protein WA692_12110, partial [Paraburkholderia caledonica]
MRFMTFLGSNRGRRRESRAPAWVRAIQRALMHTLTCALLLGVAPLAARAEVAAADPIDAAMRTCLARSDMSSTMGQVQCMETARIGWKTA